MFAALAAITLISCDPAANKADQNADSIAFSVDSFGQQLAAATDSAAVVGLIDQANAEVQTLFEKGDTIAAQTLIEKIKQIISTNQEKLAAIAPSFATLAADAVKLPEGLKAVAEAAADSAQAAVADKANEVVDAAKAEVEKKANEVVDKAADKAAEAVDKAAKQAGDAVDKAAADVAKKLGRN